MMMWTHTHSLDHTQSFPLIHRSRDLFGVLSLPMDQVTKESILCKCRESIYFGFILEELVHFDSNESILCTCRSRSVQFHTWVSSRWFKRVDSLQMQGVDLFQVHTWVVSSPWFKVCFVRVNDSLQVTQITSVNHSEQWMSPEPPTNQNDWSLIDDTQ